MQTFCINTAGYLNTLAIVKDKKLIAEENWKSERNETETILPKLDNLLKKAELKIQEIEAINIIQGVGGFTSLRVGISIANTIAYDLQIPIYGTSVFELWSKRAMLSLSKCDTVAILIDAGRQECFYFSSNNQNFYKPEIISNSQLTELEEIYWIGEINERQKFLLLKSIQELTELKSSGEAFTEIDLINKKPYQILEPWYGREPNVSKPKKKSF